MRTYSLFLFFLVCLCTSQAQTLEDIVFSSGPLTDQQISRIIRETQRLYENEARLKGLVRELKARNSEDRGNLDIALRALLNSNKYVESLRDEIDLLRVKVLYSQQAIATRDTEIILMQEKLDSAGVAGERLLLKMTGLEDRIESLERRLDEKDEIISKKNEIISRMVIDNIRRELEVLAVLTPKKALGRWQPSGFIRLDENNAFQVRGKKIKDMYINLITGSENYESLPPFYYTLVYTGKSRDSVSKYLVGSKANPEPIDLVRGSARKKVKYFDYKEHEGFFSLELFFDEDRTMIPVLDRPFIFKIGVN